MAELATVAVLALGLATAGFAAYRLRMPPALGYLLAGIGFAAWAPGTIPSGLTQVAELGVLVLLFLIGIELDLKRLLQALRSTAATIPFDIAIPALLGVALGRFLGWPMVQAAALGIVLGVSSTLFGERLAAQPNVQGPARQRVLGVLISEDLAAGALIALLVVVASGARGIEAPALAIGQTMFVVLLLAAGAILLVPRVLDEVARRHVPELLVLWGGGLLALFAYLGSLVGSRELGAMVAGVAAAEAGSRYVTRNSLGGLRDIASAVFFFAAGAAVPISAVGGVVPAALALAAVVFLADFLVHVPTSLASGLSLRNSIHVAASLGTLGEFNLILVAIAAREGIAHPDLLPMVVGAMLILLPAATLMTKAAPAIEGRFRRWPRRMREPLETLAHAVRRKPTAKQRGSAWRLHARRLVVDVILLIALSAVSVWARPWFPDIPQGPTWSAGALWFGVTVAVAMPLLYAMYSAYRDLVWSLVGLQPGERVGAGKVRARLVDAWMAFSIVVVLAFISLWVPRALPVLAGGAVIAIAIAAVAWRRLSTFHRTLANALGRVLGDDAGSARLLDQVLEKYPWGVRFAAVTIPPGSPVAGRTLKESRLGVFTGTTVAVIQRGRQETVSPPPETELLPGDHLVLIGDQDQLGRAEALIVAHGDAVRLTAQSLAAEVIEVVVSPRSNWAGKPLGQLRVREDTGTLVIGVLQAEQDHPKPFHPDLVVKAEDRLILLGTPLQLQRARILAEAIEAA